MDMSRGAPHVSGDTEREYYNRNGVRVVDGKTQRIPAHLL